MAVDIRVNHRGRPDTAAVNACEQTDIRAVHARGRAVDIEVIDAIGIRSAIAGEAAREWIHCTADRIEALLRIPVRRIGCCNGRPQRIAAPEIAIIVGIRAGGFIMRSIVSRFLGNRRRILDGLQLIDVIDKHIIGLALDGRIRGCICIAAIR